MAIANLYEMWAGRVVEEELESQRVKYNRIFLVEVDDPTDAEVTVLMPDPAGVYLLPELGDPYVTVENVDNTGATVEEDTDAICKRRSARQSDEGWMFWIVTCEYDTDAPDPEKEEPNPLNRTPDVEYGVFLTKETLETDIDGNPIRNSAGVKFSPPPTQDATNLTLAIIQFEASFDPIAKSAFANVLNSLVWKGWPVGTVKCKPITAKRHFERGVRCWRVRYEMHFNLEQLPPLEEENGVLASTQLGNVTDGSDVIGSLEDTTFLVVGQPVSGIGIPEGATIVAINNDTSITISEAATASGIETPINFGDFLLPPTITPGAYVGWNLHLLDAGRETNSGTALTPMSTGGRTPTSALLLDGDGQLLNGIGAETPGGDPPVFLDFVVFNSADLNQLPIRDIGT